jgi:uncharacterized OB-fold protein
MENTQGVGPADPKPTTISEPFWHGCNERVLKLQRCEHCQKLRFYPAASCPACGAVGGQWTPVSGRGTVYSWIVVHKNPDPYWQTQVPYVSAIVELAEQERVFVPGLLSDITPDAVRSGLPVTIWFEDTGGQFLMPRWRPAQAAGA